MSKESNFKIRRAFASFGGICRYNCNHCYTFIDKFSTLKNNSISEIINELETKDFNIVYISGYNENFYIPKMGINLIERLYERFKCHILFTTRNVFNNEDMKRIQMINRNMRKDKKMLCACVSISAYDSYKKLESNSMIPTPNQRIEFIKKMYNSGILTFLTLRPICPNDYIPTNEYINILSDVGNNCSGVISSGIVVNDDILKRLNGFPIDFRANEKLIMPCLCQDNLYVKYIDVEVELRTIKEYCVQHSIPFYSGSVDAIQNSLADLLI